MQNTSELVKGLCERSGRQVSSGVVAPVCTLGAVTSSRLAGRPCSGRRRAWPLAVISVRVTSHHVTRDTAGRPGDAAE